MRTPFLRREAGGLINRTVTVRTIRDFKHPRTGSTALLLSTTTELLVIDLIAQHDPQPNAQLAGCCHACFPQAFLHQFAAIESLQLGIAAHRMSAGFIPKKAQQRTALLGQRPEPLVRCARVFAWNQSDVTGQRLAIGEALRVAQKDIRRQCRDRAYSRMGYKQACPRRAAPLARRLVRSVARFLLPSAGTAPAACSADKKHAAATAGRRFSLARHSSTGQGRVASPFASAMACRAFWICVRRRTQ